jgi:uncharacterized protein YqfA (UPF0365 family)
LSGPPSAEHQTPPHTVNHLLAQSGLLPDQLGVVLLALAGVVMLVLTVILVNFGLIYIRALFSGAKVTITELIALRLRRVPLSLVVDNRIAAVRSGLPLSIDNLSTHHLAGGNISMVVLALIAARKAGIQLVFDRACAIDPSNLSLKPAPKSGGPQPWRSRWK